MPRKKNPIKILYLDIETAPANVFTWSLFPNRINISDIINPGYILCWAAMWEGERSVKFSSIYKDGHDKMISDIHSLLDEADAVVHYNGTKFDIPTLNREFVKLGLTPPSFYSQIDLIKTVRKQFRFTSNKLDWVCQELGLGTKVHHKGMSLWHGCMNGDDKDWKIMEKYNKQDVKLLQKLYKRLLPWIPSHPNLGLWITDPTTPVCPTCGSSNLIEKGTQHNTKTASYKRYKCNSCGTPCRSRLQEKRTSPNVLVRSQ